jgi:hypothetical protein
LFLLNTWQSLPFGFTSFTDLNPNILCKCWRFAFVYAIYCVNVEGLLLYMLVRNVAVFSRDSFHRSLGMM